MSIIRGLLGGPKSQRFGIGLAAAFVLGDAASCLTPSFGVFLAGISEGSVLIKNAENESPPRTVA